MDKSITTQFLEKLFKPFKDPETLEDALKLAGKKHDDVKCMMQYVEDDGGTKIIHLSVGMAVDNATGYLDALNDYAMNLGGVFHKLKPDAGDLDTYYELKEIQTTFKHAEKIFTDYILEHDPSAEIPSTKVHLGYFDNVVKSYEPDTRPRATVTPIRPGIEIDG